MRLFPLCSQQIDEGCVYLRNEVHQDLTEKLNRSLMVIAHGDNENGGGTIFDVKYYLANTYLRRHYEFPALKHSPNTYLIPRDLNQDEVIEAGNLWGFHTEWYFHQWDVNEDSGFEPKWFRVQLKIENFSLYFWHTSFIQQAISQCGEVLHIEEEFITEIDRTHLLLEMACIDPKRILFSSTLPYGKRWKEMHIQIMSWKYNHWVPEEARLTPHEQQLLAMEIGRTPNFPRHALLAAQEKIQHFYNTPHSPTPPPSPPYFSDDVVD